MAITGSDDRILVNENNLDTEIFSSAVAIDNNTQENLDNNTAPARGSGIVIGPNHVLTNYHVVYPDYERIPKGIRVTLAENVPSLPSRSQTLLTNSDYNVDLGSPSEQSPSIAISSSSSAPRNPQSEDVGVLRLKPDSSISDTSKHIGLVTFTDPQDLVEREVSTAGYPGIVSGRNLFIDNNAPFSSVDKNGAPLRGTRDNQTETFRQSFLEDWLNFSPIAYREEVFATDATQLFAASGTVESATDTSVKLSPSIDLEAGQSGSGIWTYLEGESQPFILGLLSGDESGFDLETEIGTEDSVGSIINRRVYDGIIKIMKNTPGAEDGNKLPENAIVGSDSLDDSVVGTYRRELILGKDGNDVLDGMEADNRLEGGNGEDILIGGKDNDLLDGGAGDDELSGGEGELDIAKFSGSFADYEYSISEDEEIVTIDHVSGTSEDGKDTLRGIEFAQFNDTLEGTGNLNFIPSPDGEDGGNQNIFPEGEEETVTRIVPLPLEDGVEKTEVVEATDTTANPNSFDPPTPPNVSLTAPVAMLDGM